MVFVFETLLILYVVFNVIALLILSICCFCALVGNSRLNKLATAKVALPTFADCKSTFTKTCIVSSIFLLMDWLLFAGNYVNEEKITGVEILSENALLFSFVWAVVLAIVIILELTIKFSKNKKYQLKDALSPVIFRTVWCFILTFIIA